MALKPYGKNPTGVDTSVDTSTFPVYNRGGTAVTPHRVHLGQGQFTTPANVYGTKVGNIAMPDPYGDLAHVMPGLGDSNAAASEALTSELRGELSPETMHAIQDHAAAWGVGSGMPGGVLQWDRGLTNLGLTSEELQSQGLGNYSKVIPAIDATQTVNPALQTEVNYQNLLNQAAPDPTAAAEHNIWTYENAVNQANSSNQQGFSLGPISATWGSQGWGFHTPYGGYGQGSAGTGLGMGQGGGGGGGGSMGNGTGFPMMGGGGGGSNPFGAGGGGGMDMSSLMMLAAMM